MKNVIYILGVLVLGVIAYQLCCKKDESSSDVLESPITNDYLQAAPWQKYPLQAIETPRVDNADQPWYGGSRDFMGAVSSAVPDFTIGVGSSEYNPSLLWQQLAETYH